MNLELFSCSGGMAEGFRRAGILFDYVFDHDPDACASYEKNLGHAPIRMDVHDLLRLARGGWSPSKVDLIVADPPCTPWSRAGKRQGLDDERDMLKETAELIQLLRPARYLIGNVPGLQDASSWGVVQDVIGGLSRFGYCVDDYAQLDAADFGVPQHRLRPFWFGHLGGPCLRWPHPTHCSPDELRQALIPGVVPLHPWVTCRQALQHLPIEHLGRPVRLTKTAADQTNGSRLSGYVTIGAEEVPPTITRRSEYALTPNDKRPINDPDAPSMTVCAKDRGGAQGARALAWPWERPSTTIQKDERIPPPGHKDERWQTKDGGRARSTANAVILSELAGKILQGFPESWHFAGKAKRSRWAQLGMAMPPPMAEAVARAVAAQRATPW